MTGEAPGQFLFPEHQRELAEQSAIDAAVIAERGYRSIGRPSANDNRPREELQRLGFPSWAIREDRYFPGLLIPIYRATGERISAQWKPRVAVPNRDGKAMKYASPKGRANVIDVHPRHRNRIVDPTVPIVVVEGVKKADAFTSRGACAIAITGVYNWRSQMGTLGDWEDVPLRGRDVTVCFDADATTNRNVLRAMQRFGQWLASKGAKPRYLVVPAEVKGVAVKGADDYFAAGGTLDELMGHATGKPPEQQTHGQDTFTDARQAEVVTEAVLAGRYAWTPELGWLSYDGTRWVTCSDVTVAEELRQYYVDRFADVVARFAAANHGDPKILDLWRSLLSGGRQNAVLKLCRGLVQRKPSEFDSDPDLLNTPTGVVDLRTGDLLPHDPNLLLTKTTLVGYDPGAQHPDWEAALRAVPDDCHDWLQARMGQAITGHMTPDDVLLIQQGGGQNGKSTVTSTLLRVIGGYGTLLSHRVLMANPDNHPTELVDLFGVRMAVMEETPEARRLSVVRLKQTIGTPTMKARRIAKDPLEWQSTHSIFICTNYQPAVDEVDHGTWRRLALLCYPFTFRNRAEDVTGPNDRLGDPTLRSRCLEDPAVQRAALAWLVAGAVKWYAAGRVLPDLPKRVADDTDAWRAESDRILGFWRDRLVADPNAVVLADELLDAFNDWLSGNGHHRWPKETFTPRFKQHDTTGCHRVEQRRTRKPDGLSRWADPTLLTPRAIRAQETVWTAVRFRTAADLCKCGTCAECADPKGSPSRGTSFQNDPKGSAHPAQDGTATPPTDTIFDAEPPEEDPICPNCKWPLGSAGHFSNCT